MTRVWTPRRSREACLRRAAELDWLAEGCGDPRAHAEFWAEARLMRSLALVARAATDLGQAKPAEG